jgi:hypothetical protein
MDDFIAFGGEEYFILLVLLLFARGMDFLSTWVATPHLVLEGNPIAKWLGWKWGMLLNLALCLCFARAPLPAVIISTTSVLVAARNFQGAWLMRTMGEQAYRHWMGERLAEARTGLFLLCLFAQCLLTAGIGATLVWFGDMLLVPTGVGVGMIGYALAVLIYSLISVWRRRSRDGGDGVI